MNAGRKAKGRKISRESCFLAFTLLCVSIMPARAIMDGQGHDFFPITAIFLSSASVLGGQGLLVSYGINAGTITLTGGITASSGTFTQTGDTLYSLQTSSGINVMAGGVTAPYFAGSGAGLSGVATLGANTFSGAQTLPGDPAGALQAATKQYVDTFIQKPASPSQGDVMYYNGTSWVRLAAGTAGYVLKSGGTGASPYWDVSIQPPTAGGEWLFVPGNSSIGTNDFYVMKYEAKNVGGVATSQAAVTPWVSITQTDSITQCAALGSGYHLLTIAETQTINRNIEAQTANWANGTIGSLVSAGGGLKRGNAGITDSAS
ncbi:MAG: hypothetical protein AAB359_05410, partial [Elusimicrobiota bacterium]